MKEKKVRKRRKLRPTQATRTTKLKNENFSRDEEKNCGRFEITKSSHGTCAVTVTRNSI